MDYDNFILQKQKSHQASGFKVDKFRLPIWEWQRLIVGWLLEKGRACAFEECGLGKTIQQLEVAYQVVKQTGGRYLIIAPLAVSSQTYREAARFGIRTNVIRESSDVKDGINIINYQRLDKIDCKQFVGVGLDESSILKSFDGKTRQMLTDCFCETPFRHCYTATPSPNDFTELGQHAEFLGICTPAQMLATYFINDTFNTGTWRLKKHAEESFWRWVASWACCVSKPSDIGYSDEGFNLTPVKNHVVVVNTNQCAEVGSGELFRNPNLSATALHEENRRTLQDRCEAAAKVVNSSKESFIVWCHSNNESELLHDLIPDSVEVTGSMDADKKEDNLNQFSSGKSRVIVTKGKIAGFGMNWQHCANDLYVGLNHSFETFYQCGKRIHRFGQKKDVNRYIIQTDSENGVMRSILRKQEQHDKMKELVKFSREELSGNSNITMMKTKIDSKTGDGWTAYHGDCVRVAKTLEDNSIGFSIFSPPFADLFTYSADVQDMGNCNGMDEFMQQFEFLIDELQRVMMPGREVAVHCCDLLATKWKDGAIEFKDFSSEISKAFRSRGFLFHSRVTIWKSPVTEMQRTKAHGLLYKTLQKDSSNSRVGAADYLLVFRKRGDNSVPIEHLPDDFPLDLWQEIASPVWMTIDQGRVLNGELARDKQDEKHICPLQLDIIERALFLWSAKGDFVFSPFMGIGSEGFCALKMKRKFIGAELKERYFNLACSFLDRGIEESKTLFEYGKNSCYK